MLEQTTSRIDSAHEHMTNVNSKMKETLNEVGRSSDKLCVDIMCIVSDSVIVTFFFECIISDNYSILCHSHLAKQMLAVGFAGIFYKMSKGEWGM